MPPSLLRCCRATPSKTKNQIVLGAATLAQLHKHVGRVRHGLLRNAQGRARLRPPDANCSSSERRRCPPSGASQTLHTSMGTGAMIPIGIEPPAFQKFLHKPGPDPERPRHGPCPIRGQASIPQRRSPDLNNGSPRPGTRRSRPSRNGGGAERASTVLPVQYPAEIENYRSIGSTPLLLAGGLAVGAVVALGLTLVASVRRRRRDLALLKSLGFTQRTAD